jgi:short-subunit dehydrogenase
MNDHSRQERPAECRQERPAEKTRYTLITGASGGLGSAFALQGARRGWHLILVDLPGTGLADAGLRLSRAYRVEAQCHELDLADAQARVRLCEWIRGNFINLALLVNNAGTGSHAGFEDSPLDRLAGIIDVNIKATMALTHMLLPELRKQQGAAIINVASLAAFYPMPAMAVYAASKSFILNFTLALRAELRGTGVSASALCPAGMVTNRDTADQVHAQGLFGRITTWQPEDVAAVAIRQALRGRAVIIPGLANRMIRLLGEAVPRRFVVSLIGRRWRETARTIRARAERTDPIVSDQVV